MKKIDPFDVVLIDPPWPFKVWEPKTGSGRSASRHYTLNTLSLEDIYALDIQGVMHAKRFVVALWATWPLMFVAPPRCFEAWGVTFRTRLLTWAKLNKRSEGFSVGNGYYARSNDEPLLLAAKGSLPRASKGVRSMMEFELDADFYPPSLDYKIIPTQMVERLGRHSEKPYETHKRIEALWPTARKLELFAREPRQGWTCLGNEITGNDIRFDLEALKGRIGR